jgi:hypothetical protein
MPLFNENVPDSQFMIDPTYLPDDMKWLAATNGYKQNGEKNDWGKISRFIPGVAASQRHQLNKFNADEYGSFWGNVQDMKESDANASKAGLGFGIAAAGAVSEVFAPGNPIGISAITQGAKVGMSGASGATNDVNLSDDWSTSFHPMAKGGQANWWEGAEDLAMIDKETGEHVGDISYGERVMSKKDNRKMKELKAKGNHAALGKFVAKAMDNQPDFSEGDGKMKKGGELTPRKAKEILAAGKVYGRDLTDKQRKFFERVASGNVPEYAGGGPIIKPVLVDDPADPRLQRYTDSMYLYNRSRLLDKYFANNPVDSGLLGSNYANPVQALSDKAPFERLGWPAPAEVKNVPLIGSDDRINFPLYKRPTQPVMLKPGLNKGGEINKYANGAEVIDMGGGRSFNNPTDVLKDIGNGMGGSDQIFNVAQFLIGMAGTKGNLPEFDKPDEWSKYLLDLRREATQGYSGAEEGNFRRDNERALGTGLNFARETSGGNGAFAIGDASRFAGDYMDRALKFAGANAEMKRRSQERYGNALLQDVSMDKDAFNLKYEEDLRKKSGAGDLANTGLQSIINQADFHKNFGPGSMNEQYLQSLIDVNKKLGNMDTTAWLKGLTPTPTAPVAPVAAEPYVSPVGPEPSMLPRSPILPQDNLWYLNAADQYDPLTGLPKH